MDAWHERDEFWLTMAPLIFGAIRADPSAEVTQIIGLLQLAPPASVLDLCCGPGRHSIELARRGFDIVGVDRTAGYLQCAAGAAAAEKLPARFVQEDMRHFCRPGAFDAAVNLYTSFGYFDNPADDRQVFMNVRRSLKENGRLLVELMGKEVLARNFRERDWREQDGVVLVEERKVSRDWGWIDCRWVLFDGTARREFAVSHRLYSAVELTGLMRDCGFRTVRVLGDLAGAPYDQNAKRLIVIAQN